MKRKIFSALAVVLFMSSNLNANANIVLKGDPFKCFDYADIMANDTACEVEETTGISTSYAQWYEDWSIFYDACMGD